MGINKPSQSKEAIIQKFFAAILACILIFTYGYFTHSKKIFPYWLISEARTGLKHLTETDKWYYQKTDQTTPVKGAFGKIGVGLTLITCVEKDNELAARIIDMSGKVIHTWYIDWFKLWPDATHIPKEIEPHSPPGTQIHGAVLMKNGDLVFNFTGIGLMRLNPCGEVVWRLPYLTHHSVHLDENDNLWVSGRKADRNKGSGVKYLPYYFEETVLQVSPSGKILLEISVPKILAINNLHGLLHMKVLEDEEKETDGDILHLNDVEPFPMNMTPGYFGPGDVMISLRNINTVLIFQKSDLKVKALTIGEVVKQHDPDFIDGNKISIFDNNVVEATDPNPQSRIVVKSFIGNKEIHTYYSGNEEHSFYTGWMGKNQWLDNGNLLISSPDEARAFEIDSAKNQVWEYTNILGNGFKGLLSEAQRLPPFFNEDFFLDAAKACADL